MDGQKFSDYENYLKEISKYRKDYLDTIIEKYVNTDDPGYTIDIRTLEVVPQEGKEVKKTRIPAFGTLTRYSCKPAQQLIKEISCPKTQRQKTSAKKFFEYAQESFTESRYVENKDLNTSKMKFSLCDLQSNCSVNDVSNKDLDNSQKKVSKCEKKISTIAVRKNPEFKRNLNFLPYENIPVDDLSLSGRSFSAISNNDKKVSSSSNSNGDTDNEELDSVDKQRKDKYPVKINCNSKLSCTKLTSKEVIYVQKWQAPQNDGEEIVIHNPITSYAINNSNPRSSVLSSYTHHYKELEFVNKQRSDECSAKFHCETLCITRAAKLRNPYYREPQICQNSCTDDYEEMDFVGKQKVDECPAKSAFNNGLSIINDASRSNNVHVKKLSIKRRIYPEDSKKIIENFISTHTKVNQNMVCNHNIQKVPRVILKKLHYSKYA